MAHFGMLLSRNPRDADFAAEVCAARGLDLFHASDIREVRRLICGETVFFWDLDATDPPQIALAQLLLTILDPSRIFGFGDKPLNEYTNILKMHAIGHYLRRGHPAGEDLVARLVAAVLSGGSGLEQWVSPGTQIKKIMISRSKDCSAIAEAVSNVLGSKSLPPRLAQTAAQAVDELLMNAIFDAPFAKGTFYRKEANRTELFELAEYEKVEVQMATTETLICLSVTDRFGSLLRNSLLSYLAKDYERTDYRPRGSQSAGVGIYGIVDSGLSLFYLIQNGRLTQATLLVPVVKGIREYRSCFQIFSVIQFDRH